VTEARSRCGGGRAGRTCSGASHAERVQGGSATASLGDCHLSVVVVYVRVCVRS